MFYLKFLQSELTNEEIKGKFIILDTYFYQKLSKNENDEMSTPLINYNSVKKWTKQLNFFQNEYVIVPINFDDHWSLLIICHPGKIENCFKKAENNNNDDVNTEICESPKYPLIIYLDSFYEDNARCRSIFKKYLYYEFAHKHLQLENEEKIMSIINDTQNYINEFVPNVPKQPNCYDCGIFLLAYAELFLYDPKYLLKAYKESNSNLPNWFTPPFVNSKREAIQEMISKMMNKSEAEINEIVSEYRNTRDEKLKTNYDVPMSALAQFEFPFDMNKTESNNINSESDSSNSLNKYSDSSKHSKKSIMKDII
jgi:sentrin-specific protease 7